MLTFIIFTLSNYLHPTKKQINIGTILENIAYIVNISDLMTILVRHLFILEIFTGKCQYFGHICSICEGEDLSIEDGKKGVF